MTDDQKTTPDAEPFVQLTEDELDAIIDHINRKAILPNDACIVCGSPDNDVQEKVYKVDVSTNPVMLGGTYQPILVTICSNCGFVRFFNKLFVDRLIQEHNAVAAPNGKPEVDDGS